MIGFSTRRDFVVDFSFFTTPGSQAVFPRGSIIYRGRNLSSASYLQRRGFSFCKFYSRQEENGDTRPTIYSIFQVNFLVTVKNSRVRLQYKKYTLGR